MGTAVLTLSPAAASSVQEYLTTPRGGTAPPAPPADLLREGSSRGAIASCAQGRGVTQLADLCVFALNTRLVTAQVSVCKDLISPALEAASRCNPSWSGDRPNLEEEATRRAREPRFTINLCSCCKQPLRGCHRSTAERGSQKPLPAKHLPAPPARGLGKAHR